jgi:hypothetical protein
MLEPVIVPSRVLGERSSLGSQVLREIQALIAKRQLCCSSFCAGSRIDQLEVEGGRKKRYLAVERCDSYIRAGDAPLDSDVTAMIKAATRVA